MSTMSKKPKKYVHDGFLLQGFCYFCGFLAMQDIATGGLISLMLICTVTF